ncbi:hypothetical protein ABRP55_13835 [Pectobacterium zantedeschiae]|uniref:hypothetical protein n=1 Tax=Pectobacterium zantedeschiae TaxID=2034769 RepID=UPI0032EE3B2B
MSNKDNAVAIMQEYFPNGGRDYDSVCGLFDAIAEGKIPGVQVVQLNPPRNEMLEYIKAAIGEGYQPEHEAAVSDLAVIDSLPDHDLNREFGKCWQWYNMGGGIHETFDEDEGFALVIKPVIKYLAENHHPHTHIVVTSTNAELSEGFQCIETTEYLRD